MTEANGLAPPITPAEFEKVELRAGTILEVGGAQAGLETALRRGSH
ncbi:MAG TPA: hypothetical protein VGE08_19900 [Steroidobacter sp.]